MTFLTLPMRAKDGSVRAETQVDPVDAWALDYRWSLNVGGYAVRVFQKRTYMLHREIVGLTHDDKALFVDHINGDKLDNRRANLRIATKSQNAQNQRRGWGASSYRNVYRTPTPGTWRAAVVLDGKQHHLGVFTSEVEAAKVAAKFRAEHMPYSPEAAA